MKLSTKGRYGTRAALDIALNANGDLVRLRDVAERQQISRKYLEHLVTRLEAGGVLRTSRGAQGGVALAKPASSITILDLLQALEGPLSPIECVSHPDRCGRSEGCATRELWSEMGAVLEDFLRSRTLEDLCERQREKAGPASLTYYI